MSINLLKILNVLFDQILSHNLFEYDQLGLTLLLQSYTQENIRKFTHRFHVCEKFTLGVLLKKSVTKGLKISLNTSMQSYFYKKEILHAMIIFIGIFLFS